MKNKKLLENFIHDNFNTQNFMIDWQSDYLVILYDIKGDSLSCMTINPYIVTTLINGNKHLSYRPITYNNKIISWEIVNNI